MAAAAQLLAERFDAINDRLAGLERCAALLERFHVIDARLSALEDKASRSDGHWLEASTKLLRR